MLVFTLKLRLTDRFNLTSGCGGAGILWTKGLDVTPISGIQSDCCVLSESKHATPVLQ